MLNPSARGPRAVKIFGAMLLSVSAHLVGKLIRGWSGARFGSTASSKKSGPGKPGATPRRWIRQGLVADPTSFNNHVPIWPNDSLLDYTAGSVVIAPAIARANADPARSNFNTYAGLCVQLLRWGSHNQCGTGCEREKKISHDFLLSTRRISKRTSSRLTHHTGPGCAQKNLETGEPQTGPSATMRESGSVLCLKGAAARDGESWLPGPSRALLSCRRRRYPWS
jgi:hypothetical protein